MNCLFRRPPSWAEHTTVIFCAVFVAFHVSTWQLPAPGPTGLTDTVPLALPALPEPGIVTR